MELVKFKDFSIVEINADTDDEDIRFTIVINIKQTLFRDIVDSWLTTDNERSCQSLCDYINKTDGQIAYTNSDFELLKKLPDTKTMN
jgi:hypothetical protein|tara:strand:+ start:2380 stop:2640 length:261 start_codon:yes stop_codon:yes gene_type:complete